MIEYYQCQLHTTTEERVTADADSRWSSTFTGAHCHFLNGRSPAESRTQILASFALYFADHSTVTRIHHRTADAKVPIWNADEMIARLVQEGKDVTYEKYDSGHGLAPLPAFQLRVRENVAEFLSQ